MPSLGRSVLAVFLGLVAAVVVIMTIEMVCSMLYPMPPGLDLKNPDAVRIYFQGLPLTALLIVVVGWALGSVAGGWMAAKRAPVAPMAHALVVGAALLVSSYVNLKSLPHPGWMWAAGPLSHVLGVIAGARLAIGGTAPSPSA